MQKVLVTGATGFIGNYVVEELLQRHCHVIASSADEAKARQKKWFADTAYIPLDLSAIKKNEDYFRFFGKPDVLIHLSWEGLPNYKDAFHTDVNLPRQKQLLLNLISNGLKNINITGTCFEYGMQEGKLSEDKPSLPQNAYARAKNELRLFIVQLKNQYSFEYKWIRLFYMYGIGQHQKSLYAQLRQAVESKAISFNMSGGEQTRDFLPVETVAKYIVDIALQTSVTGTINCCSGIPVTVKQWVQQYLQSINAPLELNFGYYPYPDYEPMHFWGDNTKLKTIIHE